MSTNRTERLLNLVIALAATTRWLSKEQIRRAVPHYAACESTEAFDRMFERDKEDLRELGVPLVTGTVDSWFEDEIGYRIDREAYALPPVELTSAELSVLALASRVWQHATLAGPAARALLKLKALGAGVDEDLLAGLEPRVRSGEAAFGPLYAATRDGAPVGFDYRKVGAPTEARRVEPWGLTNRTGRWYLVGLDRGRGQPRVFRLSRIVGGIRRIGPAGSVLVPDGVDAGAMVGHPEGERDPRTARLLVEPGRAAALRLRIGSPDPTGTDVTGGAGPDGPQVLELPVGDLERLAEELVGYAGDVVVLDPPDLAEAVQRRLRAVLHRHSATTGMPGAAG